MRRAIGVLLAAPFLLQDLAFSWTLSPSTLHRSFVRSQGVALHAAQWESALCVIPPDDAWDRLQRARHQADDLTFAQWPPAIRFFHPFDENVDVALEIADVIEDYEIGAFPVNLSQWSIIPHQEAIEANLRAAEDLPVTSVETEKGPVFDNHSRYFEELIANEERIGREKLRIRESQKFKKIKEAAKVENKKKVPPRPPPQRHYQKASQQKSREDTMKEQQAMYDEFNGPCVICLEPDEESKGYLQAFRHLLAQKLEGASEYASQYSTSGSVSFSGVHQEAPTPLRSRKKNLQQSRQADGFRPVVPIAAFKTVSSAIEVARKLRENWEPLSFNVTDLQIISCKEDDEASESTTDSDKLEKDGLLQDYYARQQSQYGPDDTSLIARESAPTAGTEEEWRFSTDFSQSQFGCDALISLVGEEMEMDDELNEEMAQLVFEQGEAGGFPLPLRDSDLPKGTQKECQAEPSFDSEGVRSGLEKYLLEEEEGYNEGTVVVIGRVQYFTGEMREYVGMPASSVMDSRDRMSGNHFVSGAARRRAAVHRMGIRYEDGDWGRKEVDYEPWGKGERRKKKPGEADSLLKD